jgi:hypothetical protein
MPTYASTENRTLNTARADVHQLTHPIHIAIRGHIHTHPPLLDQLRKAGQPARGNRSERRTQPRSSPPASLDPLDALAEIYVELAGWAARINLPSPPRRVDWHKHMLRQLAAALPKQAGAIADWAARDINHWWTLAARHTGWQPRDLIKLR